MISGASRLQTEDRIPARPEGRDSLRRTRDGKDGDLAGQDKESQEVSMLALHLLQSALVHVNTLLMQQVLADPKWADTLTDADRRALSPLFWTHVNPYGRFELDMNRHLDLDLTARDTVPVPRAPEGRPAAALGGGLGLRSPTNSVWSPAPSPHHDANRCPLHGARLDADFMVPRLTASMADASRDQAGAGQPDVFACRRRLLELLAGFL
ncbi:Tn3 family transposase [Streptomyces avermitilis]|uniref:Tn3 family transposase n=1 Tax=Streptomyces avermitilis TaxID=33903 RepID=UPI0033B52D23